MSSPKRAPQRPVDAAAAGPAADASGSGRNFPHTGHDGMGRTGWDRELNKAEVQRLAPCDRGRRALLSFERKVALIEAEGDRIDDGGTRPILPVDRAKLRRWTDPARGLWAWSTPAFDHPKGNHASLVARFEAATDRIRLRHGRGRGALRREIAANGVRIARLEAQVMQLMAENRRLRASIAGASGPRHP